MKLIDIVSSVEALNKLAETKLPASVAFGLGKFLKSITADVDTYNKVKMDKASQYGVPVLDRDGNKTDQVTFTKDGKVTEDGLKFVSEMQEIENKEIDVKIPEIKISDLKDVNIETKYMLALQWLIKD